VSSFDVRVFAIRRRPGRRVFEVRWRVAGGDKSRSFITRALADSYRAELIRAARRGLEFDPATGEPLAWAAPVSATVTWYQHAVAYAAMKWPHLAAHSRASMAEALATVTPLLTKTTSRRPPARMPRATLYGYAFSPPRRSRAPEPATASALAWLERNSLPVSCLSDPQVIRAALDGLCVRLDDSPAAANTITRKRAVLHNALGYAVELGLLPRQPGRQGAVARTQGRRRGQPAGGRQSGAGPGHLGSGRPDAGGPGGVLRLPVLRGAAPRRSRRASPKPSHPPLARARGDDSHRCMPAHRRRLDQQWQAA